MQFRTRSLYTLIVRFMHPLTFYPIIQFSLRFFFFEQLQNDESHSVVLPGVIDFTQRYEARLYSTKGRCNWSRRRRHSCRRRLCQRISFGLSGCPGHTGAYAVKLENSALPFQFAVLSRCHSLLCPFLIYFVFTFPLHASCFS